MNADFEIECVLLAPSWSVQRTRSLAAGVCANICLLFLVALLWRVTPEWPQPAPPRAHILLATHLRSHSVSSHQPVRVFRPQFSLPRMEATKTPLLEAPAMLSGSLHRSIDLALLPAGSPNVPKPPPGLPEVAVMLPPARVPQIAPLQTGVFSSISTTASQHIPAPNFSANSGFDSLKALRSRNTRYSAGASESGFDSRTYVAPPSHKGSAMSSAAPTKAVEILGKPRPAYTEEARRLKIEGEVWLEILFRSDGTVAIQRIVRGLGHGLDENAITAASEIRFHPAEQNGKAVDQLATLRVQFQLAN